MANPIFNFKNVQLCTSLQCIERIQSRGNNKRQTYCSRLGPVIPVVMENLIMSQAKETVSLIMIKTVMLTSVPVMKLRPLVTMTRKVLMAMTSIQYM